VAGGPVSKPCGPRSKKTFAPVGFGAAGAKARSKQKFFCFAARTVFFSKKKRLPTSDRIARPG
jgi:hypothetical protein